MTTEIEVFTQQSAIAAFTQLGGIDSLISALKSEASAEVPDITTAKGRARIASLAHKVSKTKVLVDDFGKELVSEEKKRLALIDADRKKWRDACDALRDEIRKPLTDWEQTEADRVRRHQDSIDELRGLTAKAEGQDSATIAKLLAEAESIALGDHWQEFAAAAGEAKDAVILMLKSQLLSRKKYEADQEELSRLRAEAARREQEERERRIAEEAAAKARAEAEESARREREAAERAERESREAVERARIAAEQAEARAKAEAEAAKLREQEAERRRIESEERAAREAKESAERAERDRVAAIEAERRRAEEQARREQKAKDAEEARRLADKEHRRKINRAIMEDLVAEGISEEDAKRIIAAIVSNKVRHVRIAY